MAKISIFGILSNISMLIMTAVSGAHVGMDHLGNHYYKAKPRQKGGRERRWVMYQDQAEASLVPPEWHAWLHHQSDVVPTANSKYRQPWQKPHQPNMTGTKNAYFPPGHTFGGGKRAAATGDYRPWQPPH